MQWSYAPSRSPAARVQRRLVQWRAACPAFAAPDRPVVTFTFDDFPKSALAAADILERHGGRAGYYACTSFMESRSPVLGEMFDGATLNELTARGHEIGAHTHTHINCARTSLTRTELDIGQNLEALAEAGCIDPVAAFAFPYGETSFAAKRWAGEVFGTARGVLPGVNVAEIDRSQLRAVGLGPSAWHRKRALAALKTCVDRTGWLIFFTHDVRPSPSDFGAPPGLITELVQRAVDAGAVLATPTLGAVLCGVMD